MPLPEICAHGRRFGDPYATRTSGSPLEPTGQQAHEAWFTGGRGGEVGALRMGETLHLAVGANGRAWRIRDGSLEALPVAAEAPEALEAEEGSLSSQDLERRAPLASLTWCSVTLEARDRFLLDSGLDLSADELDLSRSDEDLVAAIPTGASVGLFAKLFGKAKAREGAVMLLSAEPATPAPDGWLTWLEFQTGRDLEFHCWGTEGGTEMATHSEPAAQRPTAEALLDILRTHPSIVREQFADLYDDEAPRDPELQELVPGTPERGFWRSVPPSELAEVFTAHTSSGPGYDLRSDQFLPGSALVDRMRDTLDQPAAVALHAGHEAEAAVVWFAVGGISRSSGQLECFLSERVWT